MDYQRFIKSISNLYENWGQESVYPKSNRFQQIIEQVGGTITANTLQLLNCAVDCMEPDEIYCEIGCSFGASLIGALFKHQERMAYVTEKFSESENPEKAFETLFKNISDFDLEEQIVVCDQDFEEFLFEIKGCNLEKKVGVYFYNGLHDYRSQIMGLLLAKPLLARKAIIVLGNSNNDIARQATWDFIAAHSQCQILQNLPILLENKHPQSWSEVQILIWDVETNNNYDFLNIRRQRNDAVIKAIYNWQVEFDNKKEALNKLRVEAIALDDYGCYEEAESKYKELVASNVNQPEILFNLGILYYKTSRYQQALNFLIKSLELESPKAIHHYSIGLVMEKLGDIPQAIQAYQQAITLDSQSINAYNNLGNILLKAGELEQAESIYRAAITANPNHFGSYLNLGNVLMKRNHVDGAIEIYEKALNLKPRHSDIIYNLGVAFDIKNNPTLAAFYYGYAHYRRGQYEEAISQYQKYLENQTGDVNLYIAFATCYQSLHKYEEAIKIYQEGIKLHPKSDDLYFSLAQALQEFGLTDEAVAVATKASEVIPDSLTLRLEKQRLLPILYETEAEIDFYRDRFTQGLEKLIQQTTLDTYEARRSALKGIGSYTNFYLQYQGKNDIKLQNQYGQLVHQVMAANYPEWAKPLSIPSLQKFEKIRVGYVSSHLRNHNGAKWALGWIKNHNRQEFTIYCYHTGRAIDQSTQQFESLSDFFYYIPEDLEAVCNQIETDKLHILIFPDIGMDPLITQIAGLRLAPIQCTAWGHPITSGLPTIDYYLSSELMEPESAEEHYSEKLVRLPNIGLCYAKPVIPQITKNRSNFQLRDSAVVYISCQSLFKYLPQYDYLFAVIAQQVPHAQFAFLSHPSVYITEKFQHRLQRAFSNFGLNSEDFCVILPRQKAVDYFNLNLVADVFLDTFSWNGGNSTLEAIACNLPVVTCPGEFMRSRHSYAILKMLGVTDTIANNEAEYIEIAVRLGLDKDWRDSIVKRMIERHSYLYDDKTCVAALDAFFRRIVQGESVSNL